MSHSAQQLLLLRRNRRRDCIAIILRQARGWFGLVEHFGGVVKRFGFGRADRIYAVRWRLCTASGKEEEQRKGKYQTHYHLLISV
jgi:hypothetical protein